LKKRGIYLMNKADLIEELSKKEYLTEKQAAEIVNLVFDGFTETLKNGGRIEIRGFGSFSVREYKAYTGRNPRTGKIVEVKPKRLPFFKVGKELKKMACTIAPS
jgi:integration host factor subunit beta